MKKSTLQGMTKLAALRVLVVFAVAGKGWIVAGRVRMNSACPGSGVMGRHIGFDRHILAQIKTRGPHVVFQAAAEIARLWSACPKCSTCRAAR